MFRIDRAKIERPSKSKIKGEIIYGVPTLVAENVACHLSVKSLSRLEQTQSTATVLYDYTLFYDYVLGITIKPNDIVTVNTGRGQTFKGRAGESHKYLLTVQTHLEDVTIV